MGLNFGYKRAPDVIAAGLFVGILLTKRVSGSHLNAGVTLGVAIIEKIDKSKIKILLTYVVAQLIGGFLGMSLSYVLLGSEVMDMSPERLTANLGYIFAIEFMFSWIFITIYLHAKCDWVAPS